MDNNYINKWHNVMKCYKSALFRAEINTVDLKGTHLTVRGGRKMMSKILDDDKTLPAEKLRKVVQE